MVNALLRCCNVDDEKTKARKRKLIKSFKSKQRFQMMDLAQKEKADAWKSFVQGIEGASASGLFCKSPVYY